MTEWQLIETAAQPSGNDVDAGLGHVIIVYDPDNRLEARIQMAMWNPNFGKWQSLMDNEEVRRPTYWMSLPEPPK